MVTLQSYLFLGAALFCISLVGIVVNRNNLKLHIDIGHISEDLNKDNQLNTEDIDVYGSGWGDNNLTDEEDIGLDLCPDIYEDGLGGCNCDFKNNFSFIQICIAAINDRPPLGAAPKYVSKRRSKVKSGFS